MSRRHITRMTSNIKTGVDMELTEKTLVVGPNASGKTSLINSIEMLLCGQVTDLNGKDVVKKPADLIRLISGNEKSLLISCVLDDGHEISLKANRTKTGATKPKVDGKIEAAMPYLDVRSQLSGSVEAAKAWLMEKGVGNSLGRDDVIAEMNSNYHSMYKQAVSRKRKPEMELLKTTIDNNKTAIRNARDEVRMLERAVEHGASGVKSVSKTQLKKAEEEESEWRESLRKAESACQIYYQVETKCKALQREVDAALDRVVNLEKECDVAVTAASVSPQVNDADEKFLKLADSIMGTTQWIMDLKSDSCIVCGSQHTLEHFEAKWNGLVEQTKSIKEASHWHRQAAELTVALTKAQESAMKTIEMFNATQASLSMLQNPSSIEELREGWTEAKMKLDQMRLRSQQAEKVQQDRKSLEAQKERLDLLKGYEAELKRVSSILLEEAKHDFVDKVQSFLPEKYEFALRMDEKNLELGYQNGVGIKTALSGAEWASMILALSAASTPDKYDLVVLTPEERAFDPNTLANVMQSLTDTPHQVILTSTIQPEFVPEGWSVVELGAS